MTQPDYDEPLDDDLPDDLLPGKGRAKPLKRTALQRRRLAEKAARDALDAEQAALRQSELNAAQRLAQIVNLHISGFSLAEIGAKIGATEAEVDQMLQRDAQRYVRSQPQLRTYVRNYVSGKFMELLEPVMPIAKDPKHEDFFDAQDRARRLLVDVAKLHGAEAPTQSEVKVDAKPEAVERLVAAIAAGRGLAYDVDVFTGPGKGVEDIVDAEVVEEAIEDAPRALKAASQAVEESDGDDTL